MDSVEMTVEPRDAQGKGPARRFRAVGRIPAVIYGPRRETTHVTVSALDFERKVAPLEGAHLINLRGTGGVGDAVVLLREMQEHPLTGRVLHADFLEVDLTEQIRVTVSLHFVGRAVGVVSGGVLQPVLREIEVECLPTQIPDFVEVDVTPLEIHGSLHVKDLALPSGVIATTDGALTVVTVAAPTVEEAPAAEPEAGVEGAAGPEAAAQTEPSES
jgi:large subunit ribosomal protein L25